ncbi:hypothetical protein SNEBB_003081 [Seison nebaliae]|nr:hypothetical protein SNEBB_003081 [Seison nebaliae]
MDTQKSELVLRKSANDSASLSEIQRVPSEESFGDSSTYSGTEHDNLETPPNEERDIWPTQYWTLNKMLKYLKIFDQLGTKVILVLLPDYIVDESYTKAAIRNSDGITTLLNITETDDVECQIAAMKSLIIIAKIEDLKIDILRLGGIQSIVTLLHSPYIRVRTQACECLGLLSSKRLTRKIMRRTKGLRYLLANLEYKKNLKQLPDQTTLLRFAAQAIQELCVSSKIRRALRRLGIIALITKLLKHPDNSIKIATLGIVRECSVESSFRAGLTSAGVLEDLLKNLRNANNEELQITSAKALNNYKINTVNYRGDKDALSGAEILTNIFLTSDDMNVLCAVSGALWKMMVGHPINKQLIKSDLIVRIVKFLSSTDEKLNLNCLGLVAEFGRDEIAKDMFRSNNVMQIIVKNLVLSTPRDVLANSCSAITSLIKDHQKNAKLLHDLDGVRLLWSLLKTNILKVLEPAVETICAYLDTVGTESVEMIRSFIGGIDLVITILRDSNLEVARSLMCDVITRIARDEENAGILNDNNIIDLLTEVAERAKTKKIKIAVSSAIYECSKYDGNARRFGEKDIIKTLVSFLNEDSDGVKKMVTMALYELSLFPNNCMEMISFDLVSKLLPLIENDDEDFQLAAAGCIASIRHFATAHSITVTNEVETETDLDDTKYDTQIFRQQMFPKMSLTKVCLEQKKKKDEPKNFSVMFGK